jgi:hypothetical protein
VAVLVALRAQERARQELLAQQTLVVVVVARLEEVALGMEVMEALVL